MGTVCSSTLLVEDEKVRITLYDFDAGQETGWPVHEYDCVLTAVTDCFMIKTESRPSRKFLQEMHI